MAKKEKIWSDDSILEAIPNPATEDYEIQIHCSEFTFEGVKEQPDYATIDLVIYPGKYVIELRSLKNYLFQFRHKVISYERVINVIYSDVMKIYKPKRLRIEMDFNIRGGISSHLTIDSDWEVRGGEGKYWQMDIPSTQKQRHEIRA